MDFIPIPAGVAKQELTFTPVGRLEKGVQIGADVAGAVVGVAAGVLAEKMLKAAIPEQDTTLGNIARYVAIYGLAGGIGGLAGLGVTNTITGTYATAKETVNCIKDTVAAIKEEEDIPNG